MAEPKEGALPGDGYAQIIELLMKQTAMMEEHRRASDLAHRAIESKIPFDHLAQHDVLREIVSHAPEPKVHGDHHMFTAGLQKRVNSIVDVIFSSVGYVVVACLAAGAFAWVSAGKSPASAIAQPVTIAPADKGP